MKYKICFFNEEDMVTISEMEYKQIVYGWEKYTGFEINGEFYAKGSIKRIVKFGKEEYPELPEGQQEPLSREMMEEVKRKHLERTGQKLEFVDS